ncbi:MAG: RnfABCDGE type electron transport complex subunit D [Ruminococcus sp.]|nr:RnfABCDGE type electron transport complex subunit D [Ruminococcus sp.]
MTKIPILHNIKDKNNLLNSYLYALIPLLLFGFYKNGVLLYNNNLLNLKNALIPLYFYSISIIVAIIVSALLKENYKENILICLILSVSISLNTNMFLYPILLFVLLFIIRVLNKKRVFKFNTTSLIRLFLLLSLLIGSYSYLNIGEKLSKFNYNIMDIFLGYGIGGIGTTSIFLLIVGLIILSFNKYYKKIIPITASISYVLLSTIILLLTNNHNYVLYLLNGSAYFIFIFLAADITVSPYSYIGKVIYGVLIGLVTSLLSFNSYYIEAGFISIFLISLLIPFINKLTNKKYLHK